MKHCTVLTCYSYNVYGKGALAPMNKFAGKLHGYIVYLGYNIALELKTGV